MNATTISLLKQILERLVRVESRQCYALEQQGLSTTPPKTDGKHPR